MAALDRLLSDMRAARECVAGEPRDVRGEMAAFDCCIGLVVAALRSSPDPQTPGKKQP